MENLPAPAFVRLVWFTAYHRQRHQGPPTRRQLVLDGGHIAAPTKWCLYALFHCSPHHDCSCPKNITTICRCLVKEVRLFCFEAPPNHHLSLCDPCLDLYLATGLEIFQLYFGIYAGLRLLQEAYTVPSDVILHEIWLKYFRLDTRHVAWLYRRLHRMPGW
jgi:hypothetical protein